jgi:hypothetical protein
LEEAENSALTEAIRLVLVEQHVTQRGKTLALKLALVLYEVDLLRGCTPDVIDRPDAKLAAERRHVLEEARRAFGKVLSVIPCSPTPSAVPPVKEEEHKRTRIEMESASSFES